MGYQFVHIETYARKSDSSGRSTTFIFDEADRHADACQHVTAPLPPVVLYGVPVAEVRARHDSQAADATIEAAGKMRRIRSDQHTLATVVASFPIRWDDVRGDQRHADALADWEHRTIGWLRDQYGEQLVSVVRHTDERFPHLHAFLLPFDPTMRAKTLHAGWASKSVALSNAKAKGANGKEANAAGDSAYKTAMRNWQESYWQAVGLPCGLSRRGPARRRLTRAEWKTEQASVRTTAALLHKAATAQKTIQHADAALVRAQDAVKAAKARMAEARTAARQILATAQTQAQQTMAQAEAKVKPLRKFGGMLGAMWTGFRGVQERLEKSADMRVRAAADKAEAELKAAKEAARADLRQRFGNHVDAFRRAKDEAERLAKKAETRATAAEALARSSKAELTTERSERVKAEAEREKFRGLWADADNAIIEMRRAYSPTPR
jgi:hypothetical protein